MVYIHFPSNLTEEEQMLQNKYQKLKKKKKALQMLKAPKQEPEKQAPLKRPTEAKDAKEFAKKLLKSGAISAIKVESKEKQGFKRSKNLERKISTAEKAQVSGYQPFQSAHQSDEEEKEPPQASTSGSTRPQLKKGLYESFVSQRDRGPREREGRPERPERPKQGNTIYVHGFGVTDEILRNGFTSFGNIFNISMEVDKNCGFVTFEKMETADKAISEMNGTMVSGIQLKVSLARRQPNIDSASEAPSSSNWASIAASNSQKGAHKDKRDVVAYTEDLF